VENLGLCARLCGTNISFNDQIRKKNLNLDITTYCGITLLVGALGAGLSNLNGFKRTKFLFFVIIWTFFGILLRNLYQGVLTETVIFPKQYETNLTLESMIRKNFTLMMIPELSEDSEGYEYYDNSIKENVMDFLFYKYLLGTILSFSGNFFVVLFSKL